MKSKKKTLSDLGGIMYSTDPSFVYQEESDGSNESVPKNQQDLRVTLDRKNRGGKAVTLVTGFRESDEELENLAKMLKTKCGVGGEQKMARSSSREILEIKCFHSCKRRVIK
ncbi:translation initiation factor [Pedobacter panaciterrae]